MWNRINSYTFSFQVEFLLLKRAQIYLCKSDSCFNSRFFPDVGLTEKQTMSILFMITRSFIIETMDQNDNPLLTRYIRDLINAC